MDIKALARVPKEPVYELVVTPHIAQILLNQCHPLQRGKKVQSKQYEEVMIAGGWIPRWGLPFGFDTHMRLINGKQRCLAVVNCGVTIVVLALFDLPESSIYSFDQKSATRSLSDFLAMHDVNNYSRVASGATWIYRYLSGDMKNHRVPGPMETVSFVRANDDLMESATIGGAVSSILPGGPAAALHWMFSLVDADRAGVFFEQLRTGAMLEADSPVLKLRQKFEYANKPRREGRLPVLNRMALTVMAWNMFYAGEKCSRLLWLNGPFPKIAGLPKIGLCDVGFSEGE